MAWIHPEFTNRERHEELADRLGRAERSGDLGLAGRIRQSIVALFNEEWAAFGPREPRRGIRVLDDYQGALATGTFKRAWVLDQPCELLGVRVNTLSSDRTTGSDVVDVNSIPASSGTATSIFTTQGNRPTQAAASIGDFTTGYPDGLRVYSAGMSMSYDVDTASTGGTSKTGLTVAIALRLN